MSSYACVLYIFVLTGAASSYSLQQCFDKDSISCIQIQVYKTAKSFFEKSNIELGGVTVASNQDRRGKSLKEIETEERIMSAKHVVDRQIALEDYVTTQVKHLWNMGSISWNPTHTARSLVETLTNNIIPETSNFVGEGRGKDKKQLRMLLPLLIAIKLKLAAFAAISYMTIAVIAKKAVLAGLISLLVSGFIAAKNLMETQKMHTEEMTAYHSGWEPIWQSGSSIYEHGGDLMASNSNHQQIAYGAGGRNEKISKI